ncbi:MAG: glycosyltransferase [Acidobacteria bacterium]|nr:glycosyltransferase [Acidobacteriota bacterium]
MIMPDFSRIFFVVPTLNAGRGWVRFGEALRSNLDDLGLGSGHVLIIDSESEDDTVALAQSAGYRIHSILRKNYDHGGTRQIGADLLPEAEFLIYLTQDAVLTEAASARRLLAAFDDSQVASAYGRQLPHPGATPREAFARLHNYPAVSQVRDLESVQTLGFRSIFASDSFACYRREALMSIGGFPSHTLFGEDAIVTARFHLAGYKSAYVAEATVYHSHDYPVSMEFRRYFDVGAFHSREPWLLETFGTPGSEGLRFVRAELAYIGKRRPLQVPGTLLRTAMKFVGYRVGRVTWLPFSLRLRLSMNRGFWKKLSSTQTTRED